MIGVHAERQLEISRTKNQIPMKELPAELVLGIWFLVLRIQLFGDGVVWELGFVSTAQDE
jgi:hypothetical protein